MGLSLGVIPLIDYNFAGGNSKRLNQTIRQSAIWITVTVISGVFITFAAVFRTTIIQLFTEDSSVVKIGIYVMAAMLISALFNGFTTLFTGIFQASGQGLPSVIMSVSQGILFIPVIILLHHFFGLHSVIWSMTITEIITCMTGVVLFWKYSDKLR